jgi:hypothetical protein
MSICKGIKKSGEMCSYKAKSNGFCGVHKRQYVKVVVDENIREQNRIILKKAIQKSRRTGKNITFNRINQFNTDTEEIYQEELMVGIMKNCAYCRDCQRNNLDMIEIYSGTDESEYIDTMRSYPVGCDCYEVKGKGKTTDKIIDKVLDYHFQFENKKTYDNLGWSFNYDIVETLLVVKK